MNYVVDSQSEWSEASFLLIKLNLTLRLWCRGRVLWATLMVPGNEKAQRGQIRVGPNRAGPIAGPSFRGHLGGPSMGLGPSEPKRQAGAVNPTPRGPTTGVNQNR